MGKLVGYARVSTKDQELAPQVDALLLAGCDKSNIYTDKVSGAKAKRPGLDKCLASLEAGDTLLVWRLDRLGRSMAHLVETVAGLGDRGISFKSLHDGAIDTSTPSGELVFHIFSAIAQFERMLIAERTKAGLDAARARGRSGGRKKVTGNNPKVIAAKSMHNDHKMPIDEICKTLKISRSTFYRYLTLEIESEG